MRIVLVHPAGSNWVPGKKDVTPTANRMAPLGLLSIAAYLLQAGHELFIHDCLGPKAPTGNRANAKIILDYYPDLVGFSATTSGFLDGYDLATMIKKARPQIKTVFGGVHISSMGSSLLGNYDNIDFLCLGEGEATLEELASGKDIHQIDGLIWKDHGQPVTNLPRSHIQDLDKLPFPSYEKLEGFPKGYTLPLFSYILSPGGTMITSRGCPYQCSFCDQAKDLRAKGLFMMGLPGDTEESILKTGNFAISLGLDDMNMSKFTPFPGAPVWSTIFDSGTLDNDWRKMNCLNFVFLPEGIESRERLEELYNRFVKRFYTDPGWRKKFRKRLWQHRKSLRHLLLHLPTFLAAKRNFEPAGETGS